jgi:hypothetical protein
VRSPLPDGGQRRPNLGRGLGDGLGQLVGATLGVVLVARVPGQIGQAEFPAGGGDPAEADVVAADLDGDQPVRSGQRVQLGRVGRPAGVLGPAQVAAGGPEAADVGQLDRGTQRGRDQVRVVAGGALAGPVGRSGR